MKQLMRVLSYAATAALMTMTVPAVHATSVFADALVSQQNTTAFGSGLVTGAPDGGGRFLGSTFDPPAISGSLIVHMPTPLFDGPRADLRVYDVVNNANEISNISVSLDGITFTYVGMLNSVANTVDIAGLFSGPFSYVEIGNATRTTSMDVDAVEGLNTSPATATPEPATMCLLMGGLAGVFAAKKSRGHRVVAW